MEFTLTAKFNATAEEIYRAWLSTEQHAQMTGGDADVSDSIGDSFTSWDGYIFGKNLELEPNERIVQSWRTSEFKDDEEDSQIEITLRELQGETELTLKHTNLPSHGEQYRKGWEEHYFQPMKRYFSE